jgi:hypothetical protein
MKEFTLLKMEGEPVDIMCGVCSDYKKFVCNENGKKVLYLDLRPYMAAYNPLYSGTSYFPARYKEWVSN